MSTPWNLLHPRNADGGKRALWNRAWDESGTAATSTTLPGDIASSKQPTPTSRRNSMDTGRSSTDETLAEDSKVRKLSSAPRF